MAIGLIAVMCLQSVELKAQAAPRAVALRSVAFRAVAFRTGPTGIDQLADTVRHVGNADRWFGPDKGKHFAASLVVQLASYGMLRVCGVNQASAQIVAASVGSAAGIGKEIWDARGHGDPSIRDLTWDAIGVGTGAGLGALIDHRE